jgi:hypothetical protein
MLVALSLGYQKQSTPVPVAPVTRVETELEIDVTPLTYEATAEQLLAPRRPFFFLFLIKNWLTKRRSV